MNVSVKRCSLKEQKWHPSIPVCTPCKGVGAWGKTARVFAHPHFFGKKLETVEI